MSSVVDGLLDAARKDLGYRENADGYTKFGDWYYKNVDNSDSYFKTAPWCDMFITWAATQAGVQEMVGQFAYTVDHAKWFKEQGAWSASPQPGAIVFYDWGGSHEVEAIDHAGIVEKVEGGKIVTIEANVDGVWLKRKERDESQVVGYGIPGKIGGKAGGAFVLDIPENWTPDAPTGSPVQGAATAVAGRLEKASLGLPEFPAEGVAASGVILAGVLCAAVVVKQMRRRGSATAKHHRYAGRHRGAQA